MSVSDVEVVVGGLTQLLRAGNKSIKGRHRASSCKAFTHLNGSSSLLRARLPAALHSSGKTLYFAQRMGVMRR